MPTLHVLQGPDKGRTYATTEEPAVIGRSTGQVPLSDHTASRRHAEIHQENGSWFLVDLNSSNGTYLNGQRVVKPMALKHGDQIKTGSTLMVFTGKDRTEGFWGAAAVRDLVDLDPGGTLSGSSILAAVDSAAESVILQPPETADAVAAWNIVYQIAELIGTTDAIEIFLERVADIVIGHMVADHLVIVMSEDDAEALTPTVVRYRRKARGRRERIITSETIIKHVVATKTGVLCANAMTDDRFGGSLQDSIHRLGLRSVICVPIVAHEKVHGVLHLDCSMSHDTYTPEQLRLAVAIGRLVGMAIENAELLASRVRTERLAAAGETVAYLSHSIRNIVQGIQGGAEVIELGLRKKNLETADSGWTLLRRNLDRILHLTMNMLTFSKERKPRVEWLQLNAVVRDVLTLSEGRAAEKSILLLDELDDIPAIPFDREGIHQVIHNIVLNAIDVVPAGSGHVTIKTRYEKDAARVVVSIRDNGPGIAAEQKNVIFHAFHSSKGHSGTGLGLAAAHKIVEEHGGEILVESEIGHGTVFHIILPANPVALADSEETHGPGSF